MFSDHLHEAKLILTNVNYQVPQLRQRGRQLQPTACNRTPIAFWPSSVSSYAPIATSVRRQCSSRTRQYTSPPPPPPLLTTEHSAIQSGDDQFPRLRDVCTTYISMLSYIPISIRPDVADLFRQSLNDSVDAVEGTRYNAVQKFTKLFLPPACLLAALKLKQTESVGAGHHTLADTMKRRIVLWRVGRYKQLWAEAKALQTPRSTHSISDEFQRPYNTRRAIKLAEEGAYSKATQALRSDGILPPPQEVTAALLGKHPREPPGLDVDYEKQASLPSHLRVSEGEVMKAIKKFPLGSAAEGSGLRPNHICELSKVLDFGHGSTFISAMTRFVNLFLSGKVPPQLAPWLCWAPLTALQKRNGGIRPIAEGETPRRFIIGCAMNHISKTAASWVHPLQFGIATRNGTEAVVHAVRKVMRHHGSNSEYGLLSVDITNAFNLVSRNAFLKDIKDHFPSLLAWTSCCYGGEAPLLWSGEDSIRSVRGVQQGDPLGPLLFAITPQPIAAGSRKRRQESESSTDSSLLLTM